MRLSVLFRNGVLGAALLSSLPAAAATLPSGFTETRVATGIINATAMAFAPDGRIFVAQQGGQLRVVKNGALLPTPFVTITVNSAGERGLLGVAFDPDFAVNQRVYVYYTATTPNIHNRVSRFTANGDVAQPGSEVVLLDINPLSSATNHNGGAIHFGPDNKLYIAVGENANGANSQTLTNLLGKILRINSDGSIPPNNPFFNQAIGKNRAIAVLGLRNPFTFAFQPGTRRAFINDVGENTWEEINDGLARANYGWPDSEGPTTTPGHTSPLFFYGHGFGGTVGCAITGGAFYNPGTVQFPPSYVGRYFFADFCNGWIRVLDPATQTATPFASGISGPLDLHVADDGSLFYLARGSGSVWQVTFGAGLEVTENSAPTATITAPAHSSLYSGGDTFTYAGTGDDPEEGALSPEAFTWRVDIHHAGHIRPFVLPTTGAASGTFTIPATRETAAGVWYRVHLTVRDSAGLTDSTFVDVVPRGVTRRR